MQQLEIYLTKSKDLISWTEPVRVIKADRTYMIDEQGISVSNPFLIEKDGKYRLYFSAGLTYLKDCKFSEPTHISYAESDSPDGPFVTREQPVLSPTEEVEWLNRGCGCIKVYRLKDSFIGLLNGIYVGDDGKSRSAIMLFKSDDGDNFSYAKHILKPCVCGNSRWMAQYASARRGVPMPRAVALELIDAYNNTGNVLKKRDDTHKMAQANKAFAHYAF